MKSENLVEHVESDEMVEENVNLEESEVKHEMPEVLKQFSLWKPIGEREHFRLNNYRYELIDSEERMEVIEGKEVIGDLAVKIRDGYYKKINIQIK